MTMERKLKTYQIELVVKGPVFIGSGSEINKKEYLFLDKNTVGVVDISKLYALAGKRNLADNFERFMLKDVREDLKHWTDRNRISRRDLLNCMKYTMESGDRQLERSRVQILSCMVDPYGCPYVPGSSLKGMLRTILLGADMLKNPGKYIENAEKAEKDLQNSGVSRKNVLAKNIKEMESKAFHTNTLSENKRNAVNDYMAGIIVSDSEPLSRQDIILCKKWEKHVDGSMRALNILRECLRPGTVIKSTLTIDEARCKMEAEDILEAVKLFYEQYDKVFQSKFPGTDRGNAYTVFLGGGSGFVSKTIIYELFGERKAVEITSEIFDRTRVQKEHKHFQDRRLGVSPHILKCTRYQGKEYRMGECVIQIQ